MPSPSSDWWILFPFGPLVIADDAADHLPPLFGDATLLSEDAVIRAQRDIERQDRWSSGPAIAVSRHGHVNPPWWFDDPHNDHFLADAHQRVIPIAALLSVALLATSPDGYLAGLPEQFHAIDEQVLLIDRRSGRLIQTTSSGPAVETFLRSCPDTRSFSHLSLQAFLQQPLLKGLVDVISQIPSPTQTTLQESIIQACVRLASAFHAPSYTEQLLGAITSLEILLSDSKQTSFKQKGHRLAMLLGPDLLTTYAYDTVIQARHRYVHAGVAITTRTLPLQAFGLAVYALLVYAHLAQPYPTKADVLHALHHAHPQHALSTELATFREIYPLLFLTYVDATIKFDADFEQGMYDRVYDDDPPFIASDDDAPRPDPAWELPIV